MKAQVERVGVASPGRGVEGVLVGGTNGRLASPLRAIELTGDLAQRHLITTDSFRVPQGEGEGEDEGQA